MPVRHSTGAVKKAGGVEFRNLEFGREVWVGDIDI